MTRRFLTHEEAQTFYDRFGSKQDRQHWYESPATRDLLKHGGFEEASSVIELGCGTGAFAEELLDHYLPTTGRYLGVDASSTMVDLTRKRLEQVAGQAEVLLTGGSLRFDLPDRSFDRFVSNYVLDLLSPDDIRQVLDEACRLLKPDGRLCVVSLTYGRTWVSRLVTWLWNWVHRLNPKLVGGCRPLRLPDFLDKGRWQIAYHNVVTAFGVPSEVMVASKHVGGGSDENLLSQIWQTASVGVPAPKDAYAMKHTGSHHMEEVLGDQTLRAELDGYQDSTVPFPFKLIPHV